MAITINKIPLKVGDKFRITKNGEINGYGASGEIITIECILDNMTIGIYSDFSHPNWSSMDGRVAQGHGLYVNKETLSENFERIGARYTISANYEYNNINLTGKACSLLHITSDRETGFVEFDENIGGGGCDGLGKHGHCIAVPFYVLSELRVTQHQKNTPKTSSHKGHIDSEDLILS